MKKHISIIRIIWVSIYLLCATFTTLRAQEDLPPFLIAELTNVNDSPNFLDEFKNKNLIMYTSFSEDSDRFVDITGGEANGFPQIIYANKISNIKYLCYPPDATIYFESIFGTKPENMDNLNHYYFFIKERYNASSRKNKKNGEDLDFEQGEISGYKVFKLGDLLNKTTYHRLQSISFYLNTRPAFDFFINNTRSYLDANRKNFIRATHNYTSNDVANALITWEYRTPHMETFSAMPQHNGQSSIGISLTDFPNLKPFDNLILRIPDSNNNDNNNTVILNFLPNIPQPINNGYNIKIEPNKKAKTLNLTLDRSIDEAAGEELKLLSIYTDIINYENGIYTPSESNIAVQMQISNNSVVGRNLTVTLPNGKELNSGRYYITLEGTVMGVSNKITTNTDIPKESKNALFRCVPLNIVENEIEVLEFNISQPKCHEDRGSITFKALNMLPYFIGGSTIGSNTNKNTNITSNASSFKKEKNSVNTANNIKTTDKSKKKEEVIAYIQNGEEIIYLPITIEKGGLYHDGMVSDGKQITICNISDVPQGSDIIYIKFVPANSTNTAATFINAPINKKLEIYTPINVKHISGNEYINKVAHATNDGFINIKRNQTQNGTPPYNFIYTLNDGIPKNLNKDTIEIISPNFINLNVIDSNRCRKNFYASVRNLGYYIKCEIRVRKAIKCNGIHDASLSLDIENNPASSPIGIKWFKNGSLFNSDDRIVENLSPGTYKAEITDLVTGLTSSDQIVLTQPEPILVHADINNIKCNGENTGSVIILSNGGSGSHRYHWRELSSFDNYIFNAYAGTYTMEILDENNCYAEKIVEITEPSALNIIIDSIKHAHFRNDSTYISGKIGARCTGGSSPYSPFSVGNGLSISDLDSGSYNLVVTDKNNCQASTNVMIKQYDKIFTEISLDKMVSCFNGYDGECSLEIQGGVAPFFIRWSNGATNKTSLRNLPSGTYRAGISDSYGNFTSSSIIINEPAPVTLKDFSIKHTEYFGSIYDSLKNKLNNAYIWAEGEGGRGSYTYNWFKLEENDNNNTFNNPSDTLNDLDIGNYKLIIEDSNHCISEEYFFEIKETKPLISEIKPVTNVLCFNGDDASLKAIAKGGYKPYNYQWYKYDLNDINPINSEDFANIPLIASDSIVNDLNVGKYILRVIDSNGVTSLSEFIIKQPDRIVIDIDSIREPSYNGSINGHIIPNDRNAFIGISASGGSVGNGHTYSYSWYVNDSLLSNNKSTIDSMGGGYYIVVVKDTNNCNANKFIVIEEPKVFVSSIKILDSVKCYNEKNAALSVDLNGGTPPFNIRWNTNDSSNIIRNLSSGEYTTEIKDAKGVISTCNIIINQPDSIIIDLITENSKCYGDSNGFVLANVKGGSHPYTYTWYLNDSKLKTETNICEKLENDNVVLIVKDRRNCTDSRFATLKAPDKLSVNENILMPSYAGSSYGINDNLINDGLIECIASGGVSPYNFKWNNGDTNYFIENLDTGSYSIKITDKNNCNIFRNFKLNRTNNLRVELIQDNFIECVNDNNASICAIIKGGEPIDSTINEYAYSISWFKNGNSLKDRKESNLNNIGYGLYTIIVRDKNGVIGKDSIFINQPKAIGVIPNIMDATIWGEANGSINLNIFGGTPPYSIIWSTDSTKSRIENLKKGSYFVNIKDKNSCIFTDKYFINSPEKLSISNKLISNCRGKILKDETLEISQKGSINYMFEGGVPPYMYKVSDFNNFIDSGNTLNLTRLSIDSLDIGNYNIILTDSMGAVLIDSFNIDFSHLLVVSVFIKDKISCNGNADAKLEAVIAGGTPPYFYKWENLDSDETLVQEGRFLENIAASNYFVEVKDILGETVNANINLIEPEILEVEGSFIESQNDSCDGYINLKCIGGSPPYTYKITELSHIKDSIIDTYVYNSNLIPYSRLKNYKVTISDKNSCSIDKDYIFLIPSKIELNIEQDKGIICKGDSSARLKLNIKGGIEPYSIIWNTGDTSTSINNLKAGVYSVELIDYIGSSAKAEFHIEENDVISIDFEHTNVSCNNISDGEITATIKGGKYPYKYLWSNGGKTSKINSLKQGTYTLSISDQNQCTKLDSIIISQPTILQSSFEIINPICNGDKGEIISFISGGTKPYICTFSLDSNTYETMVLKSANSGKYNISITDSNKCNLDTTLYIKQPKILKYELDDTKTLCYDHEFEIGVNTFNENDISFKWQNPDSEFSNDSTISISASGMYYVDITQYDRCVYKDSILIISSSDTISSKFWISTNLFVNELAIIANVSHPKADSTTWILPEIARVNSFNQNHVEIHFTDTGYYPVSMISHTGECKQSKTTHIRIFDPINSFSKVNKHRMLIEYFKVYPNPSSNECYLEIFSNTEMNASYVILNGISGAIVEKKQFKLYKNTLSKYSLFERGGRVGLYILLLEYDNVVKHSKIIRL